ncbi:DegT/DnrJ/EryC1/StrS family aminotransferase [Mongoliibacter ruber]|uniref:dTDP-4-amino-4,6-dideoxygalactose transaminase n=1 Tax=Mongoliibacter ruber TaxID=1750599 RepID=A0A2T0WP17_9BACT|nr:dTDP-4-amino-4,6-dideoxygalactose transaminase [Mongoliibacter ruber]
MKMIPVTKPFLPPKAEYDKYLEGIWERNWLTNNGPLVGELESSLKEYLGLPYLSYLGNGTVALQLAIKALELKGEIITTPFSYVATTSSIVWEGCKPVFVDIDPDTFNIDPTKIEASITPKTSAILATHCFGNPCEVEVIDAIAQKHNLKVIYDAAHCFGTLYKGQTIFNWGDISTTSFHATKLFHTIEGGAIFAKDEELNKKIAWMRNFGHHGPEKFYGVGINGKNSEVHAAMGLVNLKHIEGILAARKRQSYFYDSYLDSTSIRKPKVSESTGFNYAYYPVVFNSSEEMMKVKAALEEQEIYPRRYFHPSLSSLNYVENIPTPISDEVASKILCLPIYHDLSESDQQRVCGIILKQLDS